MKVLILTRNGIALGLAQRLSREGHAVDVYSDTVKLSSTGGEMYKISDNLWESIQECKFIVADSGNWDLVYKRAKMYNKPIIGCNEFADQLNSDSVKEYDLCSRLGISCPKSEIYNEASKLQPLILQGEAKRYYIRHKRRTFSCTKPEWLAWAMYQLPATEKVLVQEEVSGNDITVTGWFNGLNWVSPFFYSTPYYDRIGAVAMLAQKRKTRLTENTILPLDKCLKIVDYKGPVTVNLTVNDKDVFVQKIQLGFTAPCVFAMIEGLKAMPLFDFLNLLAFGLSNNVSTSLDYIVGVEVNKEDSDMHGAPIVGVAKGNLDHLFMHGAYRCNKSYMVSNEVNSVYTAVARGRDMDEASRRVYRTISEVQFPGMKYLTNLNQQTSATFNQLKSWSII